MGGGWEPAWLPGFALRWFGVCRFLRLCLYVHPPPGFRALCLDRGGDQVIAWLSLPDRAPRRDVGGAAALLLAEKRQRRFGYGTV